MKTSIFFGGGLPVDDKSGKDSNGMPLQGDPNHDALVRHRMEVKNMHLSEEELKKYYEEADRKACVRITKDGVTLDGHVLELKPSRLAFYILVATHPEGIEKGKIYENYLDDYQDIYYVLPRKRKERKGKLISFKLDKEASKYVDEINDAIEQIEKETGAILATCKIWTDPMMIGASVENFMGTNSLKELPNCVL